MRACRNENHNNNECVPNHVLWVPDPVTSLRLWWIAQTIRVFAVVVVVRTMAPIYTKGIQVRVFNMALKVTESSWMSWDKSVDRGELFQGVCPGPTLMID